MSDVIDGPLRASIADSGSPVVLAASPAVEAIEWAPVPAVRSERQERLSTDQSHVLNAWLTRIQPGMWRNFRGEPYPAAPGAVAPPSPQ